MDGQAGIELADNRFGTHLELLELGEGTRNSPGSSELDGLGKVARIDDLGPSCRFCGEGLWEGCQIRT